jgi:hypothetical protein
MNLSITIYLNFKGQNSELEALVSDIANTIGNHDYANIKERGDELESIILVGEIEQSQHSVSLIEQELDSSLLVVIPTVI